VSMEWKALEGQRIQSVLGAIGALPAAALVFGDDAAASAPGAPLYTAAIVLMIGAYMHWLYTDGVYHLGSIEFRFTEVDLKAFRDWETKTLHPAGYRFQWSTYAYAIASLLCTVCGLMGVYSTIRSGVSVEVGFYAVIALAACVSAEVVSSGAKRNRLLRECRAWSEKDVPPA